jgi:hypothetical protein
MGRVWMRPKAIASGKFANGGTTIATRAAVKAHLILLRVTGRRSTSPRQACVSYGAAEYAAGTKPPQRGRRGAEMTPRLLQTACICTRASHFDTPRALSAPALLRAIRRRATRLRRSVGCVTTRPLFGRGLLLARGRVPGPSGARVPQENSRPTACPGRITGSFRGIERVRASGCGNDRPFGHCRALRDRAL